MRHGLGLLGAQRRAVFQKVGRRLPSKTLHGPKRIRRQRPPTRTKLDIIAARWAPVAQPDVTQPYAYHFAEHLGNFGGSDEIASRAKRISAAIISGIGYAHVFGNADGAGRLYLLRKADCNLLCVRRHCYCRPCPRRAACGHLR